MNDVDLSVIIPVFNEEDNVLPLYKKLIKDLNPLQKSYEIIFIDDGSTDSTFEKVLSLKQADNTIKLIKLRKNFGKSIALNLAFRKVHGNIIITMDGDLQDDSAEIPKFINKMNEGYDLVAGWKYPRYDPITKKAPSKIFNKITFLITGVKLHDVNCGFKAYRRDVIDTLHLYGELHRYTPVLADYYGFKITEITVRHHPRQSGRSKYGAKRIMKGFLDLITVKFLTSYVSRPLHIFGVPGMLSLLLGFILGFYLVIIKYLRNIEIGDRPLLLLSILLIVLGLQFISIGLLGEMIASYQVKEEDVDKYIEKSFGIMVDHVRT